MPDCWIFLLKRRRALSNVSFSPTRTSANAGIHLPGLSSRYSPRARGPTRLGALAGRSPAGSRRPRVAPPRHAARQSRRSIAEARCAVHRWGVEARTPALDVSHRISRDPEVRSRDLRRMTRWVALSSPPSLERGRIGARTVGCSPGVSSDAKTSLAGQVHALATGDGLPSATGEIRQEQKPSDRARRVWIQRRTTCPRAGSAASKIVACLATRRRFTGRSATTRMREIVTGPIPGRGRWPCRAAPSDRAGAACPACRQ